MTLLTSQKAKVPLKILFLTGWHAQPGGNKPTYLREHGHEVIEPDLDDDDFAIAVHTAQKAYDNFQPDVVVGLSRGGAVAMNIAIGETPLVLMCPGWKRFGNAQMVGKNTVILHSRADDVVPFSFSEELVKNSGLPPEALFEVGKDHFLSDPEPLQAMLEACFDACIPKWSDGEEELLQQEWDGLCYSAAMRWITAVKDSDWHVVHGTVFSGELEKRIEHAWCERGDMVVDLAMPAGSRIVEREQYYRVIKPEISNVYSSEDALLLSVRNGHQGPWDESEQLRKS